MPNTLYIHLPSTTVDPDGHYDWVLYDITGQRASAGSADALDDVSQILMQNGIEHIECCLLWPAQSAFMTEVELPGNQTRYLAQALPFAVEERLAQDLSSVHLVAGKRSKNGGYPVACLDKDVFECVHTYFSELEFVSLKSVVIDAQCLPLADSDMTLLIRKDSILVNSRRHHALGLSRENLIAYLDSIFLGTADAQPGESESYLLNVLIEASEEESSKLLVAELQQYPGVELTTELLDASTLAVLSECAVRKSEPHVELCQGEFKLAGDQSNGWYRWRAVAAVLLVGFVLQLGVFIGKGVYFSGQAEEVEQLAVKSYQKLVPGTKSMSAQKLGRVIKGKLNQGASNGDVATNFLDLLGEAGYHYSQEKDAGGFSFQSISYSQQRGELIIELRAKNYEQVGRLQQAIAGAGLTAKISSAVQEKGYFRGRISVSGS